MLDEQATILHHVDAGPRQPLGALVVADAELEPHRLGVCGEDVVHVLRDVLGAPKHPGLMPVLETLISTQKDFVPAEPMPNGTPVLFLSFQYPRYVPAVVGEVS